MKYQLALQFPIDSIEDYDAMIALEESVITTLGSAGVLDGHDAGSGEMNIFIHTNDPQRAFDRVRSLIPSHGRLSRYKAAFREIEGETYTILYPADATTFSII